MRAARKRQADVPADEALLIRRYENVLARELLEQGRWLAKISRQNINRISGDPRRKINRLINSGVKTDQHPARLAPDVFNRVPIALWNVPDIAGVQLLRSKSTMRAEHRHAEIAFDYILPFIGVRMPMKFAQRAWFEVENYASECCRNWKSRGIDTPFAAAFENRVRRTCEHSKFVRLGWRDARPCRFSGIGSGGIRPRAK